MNKYLISTIRLSVISGVALFAFAGEALAAPVLTPVSIQRYSDTSVTLFANVSNEWKNTSVWFEWGVNSNPTTAVGVTQVWNKGLFETRLTNLTPGATYYFRSAGMEDGYIVYSPISSYTLSAGTQTTITNTTNVVNTTNTTNTANTANTAYTTNTGSAVKSNTTSNNSKQSASVAYSAPKTTTTVNPCASSTVSGVYGASTSGGARVQTYGASNNTNGASLIGAGDGMFPNTLIGWLALFIAIMGLFLIIQMLLEAGREKKKAREIAEKKAVEEKYKAEK